MGPSKINMAEEVTKRKCTGTACDNEASSLQCPTCLKLGKESYFCSQDCFKRSWVNAANIHMSRVQADMLVA